MDYAYDLLEKIQEDETDYLLITLRKGRQQFKVDVFYQLDTEESDEAMMAVLDEVTNSIKSGDHDKPPPKPGEEDSPEDDYGDGYSDEDGSEEDLI